MRAEGADPLPGGQFMPRLSHSSRQTRTTLQASSRPGAPALGDGLSDRSGLAAEVCGGCTVLSACNKGASRPLLLAKCSSPHPHPRGKVTAAPSEGPSSLRLPSPQCQCQCQVSKYRPGDGAQWAGETVLGGGAERLGNSGLAGRVGTENFLSGS